MTLSMIVPLCNGSTAGFGSVSPGSNPGGTTLDCPSGEIGIHVGLRDLWLMPCRFKSGRPHQLVINLSSDKFFYLLKKAPKRLLFYSLIKSYIAFAKISVDFNKESTLIFSLLP